MTDKGNICDMCKGKMRWGGIICTYCNGTGEWNEAARAYIQSHVCQCIVFDRKFCPVCNKKCHHTTSNNPKQKIDPGYGGTTIKEKHPDRFEELPLA